MNIGDKIKFSFAKKDMEGTLEKMFNKTIYIKADFPNHKGKIVKRKISGIKAQ